MKKSLFFSAAVLLLFSACHKGGSPATKPTVATISSAGITDSSIFVGGNISSDGGARVTDRGIMWDTSAGFSTAKKLDSGSGTGAFYLTIHGLAQGTNYYVRAYGTNSVGTGYGNTLQLKTDTLFSDYIVTTYAGNGAAATVDGQALSASIDRPYGLAVDAGENLFVAEGVSSGAPASSHVRRIAANGAVATLAALGSVGEDIVVDAAGNVYDVDYSTRLLYKITPAGVVTVLAGGGKSSNPPRPQDGQGAAASFNSPYAMDIDKQGNIFMTDNDYIRKITPGGYVSTLPVPSNIAYLGITVDQNDNLYVVAYNKIEKLDTLGNVTFIAGGSGFFADGTGAAAGFSNGVSALRLDHNGNIIAADGNYHKIRMITPAGVVTTIAGSGLSADRDGSGSTCAFIGADAIAIDTAGNIFVADAEANKIKKIAHK